MGVMNMVRAARKFFAPGPVTMDRASLERWRAARSLADLGELTAAWLEGAIASQPGYAPGHGPDQETSDLVPVLAAANRAGYMTTGSQPGGAGSWKGQRWDQRAAVQGLAAARAAGWLRGAAADAGLIVVAHDPADLPDRTLGMQGRVPVTRVDGQARTWFGANLPRASLSDPATGYGMCQAGAIAAVCAAWQVTLVDPVWGRDDVLWPLLDRFARQASQP